MAVVRVVLEANPDAAKQPDDEGNLPMHLYCSLNEQDATGEIAHLLLSQSAVTFRTNAGQLASEVASFYRKPAAIIQLLSDSSDWSPLMFASHLLPA